MEIIIIFLVLVVVEPLFYSITKLYIGRHHLTGWKLRVPFVWVFVFANIYFKKKFKQNI